MKILALDCAPFCGGAQESLLLWLQQAAVLGHSIQLLTASDALIARAQTADIPTRTIQTRHWRVSPRGILQFFSDRKHARPHILDACSLFQPDAIVANTARAGLLLTGRHWPCPVIVHARDIRMPCIVPKLLERTASRVIAVSEAVANIWREGSKTPVSVIPNPVDIPKTPLVPHPHSAPTIVQVADFERWKNHALFIKAFSILHQQHPDTLALIKGRLRNPAAQSYLNDLKAYAHALGLDDAIECDTRNCSAEEAYARADVVVSTSIDEPWGRTAAEALAHGIPVVAVNGGGIGDVLQHCPTASLTDDSPENIARAIAAWLNRKNGVAQQAQHWTEQSFSPPQITQKILEVLG